MMDQTRLCMRCMRETGGFEVCMHCGYVCTGMPEQPFELVPGTTVAKGRYLVGAAVRLDSIEIWYAGFDLVSQHRVHIREFFPQSLVIRTGVSPSVIIKNNYAAGEFAAQCERFRADAGAFARVRAANVVAVSDVFDDNGTVYAVTEFLDGCPLSEFLIKNNAHPAMSAVRDVASQLVCGIEALHAEGIIHLGISDESIWMCNDSTLRIARFNGVLDISSADASAARRLYSGVSAPELYSPSGRPTAAADEYAAAAILYRLFTGSYPPDAMDRAVTDEFEPLSTVGTGANAAMAHAVNRALSLEPSARYRDIRSFFSDFTSVEMQEHTGFTLSQTSKRTKRSHRRTVPIIAALLLALTGLSLIAVSFSLYTVTYNCQNEALAYALQTSGDSISDHSVFCGVEGTLDPSDACILTDSDDAGCIPSSDALNDATDPFYTQYIAQYGNSPRIPLGFTVYVIYINTDNSNIPSEQLFADPAAEIAKLAAIKAQAKQTADDAQRAPAEPAKCSVGVLSDSISAFEYLYGAGARDRLYTVQHSSLEGVSDEALIERFAHGEFIYIVGSTEDYGKIHDTDATFKCILLSVPDGMPYPVSAACDVQVRDGLDPHEERASLLLVKELIRSDALMRFFTSSIDGGALVLPGDASLRAAFIQTSRSTLGAFAGLPEKLYFMAGS